MVIDIYKTVETPQEEDFNNMYDEINREILLIEKQQLMKFILQGKFPLGTKKPLHEYGTHIPSDEVVWFPFPSSTSPLSILILATSGYKKTVIQKRLAYYFHQADWNCAVLEPKTAEWLIATIKPKSVGLYPLEKPDVLPIMPLIPSFIVSDIPKSMIKDYSIITSKISEFDKRIYFNTLKFSPAGVEWLIGKVKKYDTPKKLLNIIKSVKIGATKPSLLLRLGALDDDNFFDENYNVFERNALKRCWRKKKIPIISFFSQDPKYLSLYTGHLMREMFQLSIESSEFQKKVIFVDDCSLLIGKDMDIDAYLSVRELINSITLWRALGFEMVFATQSPSMVNKILLDDCKWFMIGRIGNPNALKDYIGNPEIFKVLRTLRYKPSRHIAEYCLIHPDKITYERFFPFNPPVGHFKTDGGDNDEEKD